MVRGKLVEHLILDGRRVVEKLASLGHTIRAAFWAREDENSPWNLFIVLDDHSTEVLLQAWKLLDQHGMNDFNLLNAINFIGPNDRRASEIISVLRRNEELARFYRGNNLAEELGFEETFIYPPRVYEQPASQRMTSDDVGRALLGYMQVKVPPANWPRVQLSTGEGFSGMPTRIIRSNGHGVQVEFDIPDSVPRAVSLEDIISVA